MLSDIQEELTSESYCVRARPFFLLEEKKSKYHLNNTTMLAGSPEAGSRILSCCYSEDAATTAEDFGWPGCPIQPLTHAEGKKSPNSNAFLYSYFLVSSHSRKHIKW